MSWYVIYKQKEVIDGPLPHERARAICEDLDMAFKDTGYTVVKEDVLHGLGLVSDARYHIQEDLP
ncbi:MAG: hypothetical protein QNK37_22040 [Acidobacteriota bacterium]|nr:hypothetical protein [Acidobacteriota bacterium]